MQLNIMGVKVPVATIPVELTPDGITWVFPGGIKLILEDSRDAEKLMIAGAWAKDLQERNPVQFLEDVARLTPQQAQQQQRETRPCPMSWGTSDMPMDCDQPSGHTGNHSSNGIEWAGTDPLICTEHGADGES